MPNKALITPAVSYLILSGLPGVMTDCVGCVWVSIFPSVVHCRAVWMGMRVCVCGGRLGTGGIIPLLVHFYLHFMLLCSLAWVLYRRGDLLCLVPSLIQHSWDASFQLVALCVMV